MDSFNPNVKLSTVSKEIVVFLSRSHFPACLLSLKKIVELSNQDEELLDMVMSAQEMEDNYGHYFDQIIVNTDLERTFDELIKAINELEGKAQWVPVRWVRPK